MKRHLKFSIGLLLSLAVSVAAQTTSTSTSGSEDVPIPQPPKAKKSFSPVQACVEPINTMRHSHGDFLKHHRDDTMHRGVRTTKHSLVECINCHVTPNADGKYPSIKEGTEHFCRSCHSYAAVTIDCFQCHASQPDTASEGNALKTH